MAKAAETETDADVVPIEDGKKPEQLAMFEGSPVHEYKASLAAAGYLTLDEQFGVGQRVSIAGEGYVSKVIFHRHANGVTTRQHVIVVEADETTIRMQ